MMFEEGERIEMQPSLAVNKLGCMHLPDFALTSGSKRLGVAVHSTCVKRPKFVKLPTMQSSSWEKMSNLQERYSSCSCSSLSNSTANISTTTRGRPNNSLMISYQQRVTLKRSTSSRSQVISLLSFTVLVPCTVRSSLFARGFGVHALHQCGFPWAEVQ